MRAVQSEASSSPTVSAAMSKAVGRRRRVAEQRRPDIGHRRIGQVGRQADVAVVEPDDVHAAGRKRGRRIRPASRASACPGPSRAAPAAIQDRRSARTRCRCGRGRRRGRPLRSPAPPQHPISQPVVEPIRAVGLTPARGGRDDGCPRGSGERSSDDPRSRQRRLERRVVGHLDRSRDVIRREHAPDAPLESHPRPDRSRGGARRRRPRRRSR